MRGMQLTRMHISICAPKSRREQDVYKAELIASGKNPYPLPN